jgi:ATP-binding cassette subfamily B protein
LTARERLASARSKAEGIRSDSRAQQGSLPVSTAFWLMLGRRRGLTLALVALSLFGGILEAAILAAVAQSAATLVSGQQSIKLGLGPLDVNGSTQTVLIAAIVMAIARLLLQFPLAIIPGRIVGGMARALQSDMLSAFSRASWSTRAREFEGHLQELMGNQSWQASQGAVGATNVLSSGCMLAALIIAAVIISPLAAGAVIVAAAVLFFALRPASHLAAQRSASLGTAGLDLANGVSEAGRLAQETEVLGATEVQRQRLQDLVEKMYGFYYRSQMLGRLVPSLYQSLIYLIVVVGLMILYEADTGDAAVLGAVILLLIRAGSYGQQIQGGYLSVRQGMPYIARILDATKLYDQSHISAGNNALPRVASVRFENVSYAYTKARPAVSDVSFEIDGGETVGIVGPSGAGKSTLVQLLMRLRHPDAGQYLINGERALTFDSGDWHRRVAYVPQEPKLLHASVADNIRYFRDIDDEALERAARLARIHDDIVDWSHGYDTKIGPRADAISGGQQQRICIARSLAAEPSLLVLDEPTSALDPRSENLLQESLRGLQGEITLLIVAHRMSTLDICDRVMVVVRGRVEAIGTPAELKRESEYFRNAVAAGTKSPEPDLL